jgi:hypothetical protein
MCWAPLLGNHRQFRPTPERLIGRHIRPHRSTLARGRHSPLSAPQQAAAPSHRAGKPPVPQTNRESAADTRDEDRAAPTRASAPRTGTPPHRPGNPPTGHQSPAASPPSPGPTRKPPLRPAPSAGSSASDASVPPAALHNHEEKSAGPDADPPPAAAPSPDPARFPDPVSVITIRSSSSEQKNRETPGSPCRPARPRNWLSNRRYSYFDVPSTDRPPNSTTPGARQMSVLRPACPNTCAATQQPSGPPSAASSSPEKRQPKLNIAQFRKLIAHRPNPSNIGNIPAMRRRKSTTEEWAHSTPPVWSQLV